MGLSLFKCVLKASRSLEIGNLITSLSFAIFKLRLGAGGKFLGKKIRQERKKKANESNVFYKVPEEI